MLAATPPGRKGKLEVLFECKIIEFLCQDDICLKGPSLNLGNIVV